MFQKISAAYTRLTELRDEDTEDEDDEYHDEYYTDEEYEENEPNEGHHHAHRHHHGGAHDTNKAALIAGLLQQAIDHRLAVLKSYGEDPELQPRLQAAPGDRRSHCAVLVLHPGAACSEALSLGL